MVWSDLELKQKTKQLLPEWGKYVDDIDFEEAAQMIVVDQSGQVGVINSEKWESGEVDYLLCMADYSTCLLGELHGFSGHWQPCEVCDGCIEIDTELADAAECGMILTFRELLETIINHIEGVHMDWVKAHE